VLAALLLSVGCTYKYPIEFMRRDGGQQDGAPLEAGVDAAPADAAIDAFLPSCGDGAIDTGEACDDGNTTAGDGCDGSCQVENGWYCTNEPSVCTTQCGDGIEAGTELCDDGNGDNGDGCNSNCEIDCSNASTTDCNYQNETLIPASAFVDQDPPDGFVQCAGFQNTQDNDVGPNWEANCLGQERILRIRYWDTSQNPWSLWGDATLDPTSLATYGTESFDATNQGGIEGVLDATGVTFLKDDPANPVSMITSWACNQAQPNRRYAATDLYFSNLADNHTLTVCGFSETDDATAPCDDDAELLWEAEPKESCSNNNNGPKDLAIAIYYQL
jgi:cysteine-rich repeat protein